MISIHSPHTRGDASLRSFLISLKPFQSTPLTRGETLGARTYRLCDLFQSTPLTRGETSRLTPSGADHQNFNPLPSHEGRQ